MIPLLALWSCVDPAREAVRVDATVREQAVAGDDASTTAEVSAPTRVPPRALEPASVLHLPAPPPSVFRPRGDGFAGESDDHRVRLTTTARGVRAEIDGVALGELGLATASAGSRWASACVDPAPEGCERRIERRHDGIVEWWQLEERGIRFGFDVEHAEPGELRLAMAVDGAELEAEGDGFRIVGASAAARLSAPLAWDAAGRDEGVVGGAQGRDLVMTLEVRRAGAYHVDPLLTPDDE
ncbi:MAG TPA: hypothetical protein PKA64_02275, partial [Myxococcota bacterium]|nr:hypothetical protein [Myxococcota bacterium]